MKGTTTIQLFNGKTGKLEKEIKSENYITDIMDQYYSKIQKYHCCNIGQGRDLKYSDIMQGVILFDDAMPTSDCYYPRDGDVAIGYAYDVYSGDDVKRGSLNNLESGDIENGYRKVWDFGTGIAIGDINAISLTSAEGGSYDIHDLGSVGSGCDYQKAISGWASSYGDGYYLADITDDYALYFWDEDSYNNFQYGNFFIIPFNSAKLHYHSNIPLYAFGSKTTDPRSYADDFAIEFTLEATPTVLIETVETSYNRCSYPAIDNDYFYVLYYLSGVGFKLHRYSLSTGLYVDELTYDFAYTNSPARFKFDGSYLVWINDTTINSLNISTLNEVVTASPFSLNMRGMGLSTKYSNTILAVTNTSSYNTTDKQMAYINYLTGDVWGEGRYSVHSYDYGSNDRYMAWGSSLLVDEPLVISAKVTAYGDDVGSGFITHMLPNPLATINNLPSTVTKATDQVLKVIYDITW
jgi:hypothetical protein